METRGSVLPRSPLLCLSLNCPASSGRRSPVGHTDGPGEWRRVRACVRAPAKGHDQPPQDSWETLPSLQQGGLGPPRGICLAPSPCFLRTSARFAPGRFLLGSGEADGPKEGSVGTRVRLCKHHRHISWRLGTIESDRAKVRVTQSCPTLRPMDHIVHGILQARILEWVAIPFSRGSSQPRD